MTNKKTQLAMQMYVNYGRDKRTHDVALVELALEVVEDVGARSHVRRDEDVGPVICPSRVVLVVI